MDTFQTPGRSHSLGACLLVAASLLAGDVARAADEAAEAEVTFIAANASEPSNATISEAPAAQIDRCLTNECDADCEPIMPNMLGDFIGGFYFGPAPGANIDPRALARMLPRFKVADNNSPLPRTRAEYSYNYFHDAFDTGADVHRNFFGGEAAMFDQNLSIAVRGSVNVFSGFDNIDDQTEFGYLVTTLKGLIYGSKSTVISGGLAIGWPTADMPGELSDSNYILAPWAGFYFSPEGSNWFTQGFFQLDIPTEGQDQSLFHTDLGVGYYLRRNDPSRFVSMIAPTVELHAYNPIGGTGGLYNGLAYDDVVNMTVGTSALLGERFLAAVGMSFPISTEKDYDYEVQVHLNWLFGAR